MKLHQLHNLPLRNLLLPNLPLPNLPLPNLLLPNLQVVVAHPNGPMTCTATMKIIMQVAIMMEGPVVAIVLQDGITIVLLVNVWKQLHLQLQLHLHHVKTNGKPKNVTRGKIRGTVPRKRSRKTARKLVKFANYDVLSYSENTFSNFSSIFLNPNNFYQFVLNY